VLALVAKWIGSINDIQGAFLKGKLDQEKEQIAMEVPERFEKLSKQHNIVAK